MRIYKKLVTGTVMGISDDELDKKPRKRTVHEEIMSWRVMKLRTPW
ncbi:MAG: hypothetical protein IJ258_05890 [Methanobrevibacter sp.]|nr:hypothetical protein [Methanobrevibacter sp.]MBQ8017623.1 hypothetical protein [Methanobrevibacter sp.]